MPMNKSQLNVYIEVLTLIYITYWWLHLICQSMPLTYFVSFAALVSLLPSSGLCLLWLVRFGLCFECECVCFCHFQCYDLHLNEIALLFCPWVLKMSFPQKFQLGQFLMAKFIFYRFPG